MKKLLTLTLTFLLTLSIFGSWKENRKITDEQVTDWVLSQLEGIFSFFFCFVNCGCEGITFL